MDPLSAIGSVANAASKALDLVATREARENTSEMQENARAKTDAEIKDDATKAVAQGNLEEIRREAAE